MHESAELKGKKTRLHVSGDFYSIFRRVRYRASFFGTISEAVHGDRLSDPLCGCVGGSMGLRCTKLGFYACS